MEADFQRNSDRERWVCALDTFDPAAGRAIIKVCEMELPPDKAGPGGFRRCIYSWREWDLLANCEVKMLRVCEEPFEEYEAPRKVHKSIVKADDDCVVIDCNFEDWDGCLYNYLSQGRCVELRNLHASYENFLKQLAELYCMELIGEYADNCAKFRRPA